MNTITVSSFKSNLQSYIDDVIVFDESFVISTNKGNVVVISEKEYNSIKETLFLHSQKGLVDRIKAGEKEDISKMSTNY